MRITVNNRPPPRSVAEIRDRLATTMGIDVPLVGDFHYNGHTLLREFPDCAEALAKYRINPGNVGRGDKHDAQLREMVQAAIDATASRCGSASTAGSLDQELMDAADGRERAAAPSRGGRRGACARRWSQSRSSSAEAAEELGLPATRSCCRAR